MLLKCKHKQIGHRHSYVIFYTITIVSPFFVCVCLNLVDFGSLFDLEHDLPDELISSSELAVANGGDLGQLHTSLGGGGATVSGLGGVSTPGQDAAAKHKQLSELLRSGAPPVAAQQQQGGSPAGASMGLMGSMKASPGPQNMVPQGQQHLSPQANLIQQQQMAGMVGGMNRTMLVPQKGNGQQQPGAPTPQQQGMIGGQMNGTPRMGYSSPGMGSNSNLLAETLQQQAGGGQGGLRAQQPGALNKVGKSWSYSSLFYLFQESCLLCLRIFFKNVFLK